MRSWSRCSSVARSNGLTTDVAGHLGRVAVHLSCAVRFSSQGSPNLTGVLEQAGVDIVTVAQPNCCGGREPFAAAHPTFAKQLADAYVGAVRAAGVDLLVSTSRCCVGHLQAQLPEIEVVHATDLLKRLFEGAR